MHIPLISFKIVLAFKYYINIMSYSNVELGLKFILLTTYFVWPDNKYPLGNAIFLINSIWGCVKSSGWTIK